MLYFFLLHWLWVRNLYVFNNWYSNIDDIFNFILRKLFSVLQFRTLNFMGLYFESIPYTLNFF